jgi:threonine dehydrogenase-like Zn-dependent dehydrogenase
MSTVRAAVIAAPNAPLEIRSIQVPELEPTAMLARVEAATLCGTDVHRWHGGLGAVERMPFIPGHETCGIIAEMNGERFDLLGEPLRVGDRVIWAYPSCGHCYFCTVARQPTLCKQVRIWGCNPCQQYPYLLGGCAEIQYVPPRCDVIRVPDEVSAPLAASAACALRTVMHGFEKLGPVASHETVLIQGAGPVGLYAAAVAKDHGAHRVPMIGAPGTRLAVGRALGVDATLDLDAEPDAGRRREWALEQSNGRGADVVIQAATAAAVPEGLGLVRLGGRYLTIGGGGPEISMPVSTLGRMVSYTSIIMAEGRHWLQAVQFLASRRSLPFEKMITGRYSLDDATQAIQAMSDFREVKPVIFPSAN